MDKHLEPAFGKKPINEISPYTAKELEIYLEAVRSHFPEHFPMFLTLARTGLRLGEALGLQWGDIDFRGKFIEIRRAWVNARLTKTKTGKTRRVDATPVLLATLKSLSQRRKEQTLKNGWGEVPEWVFVNQDGKPLILVMCVAGFISLNLRKGKVAMPRGSTIILPL